MTSPDAMVVTFTANSVDIGGEDEPEVAYCANCECNSTFSRDQNDEDGYYICGFCGCLGGPNDIGDEPMLLAWCAECSGDRLFCCIDGYAVGTCEFCFSFHDERPDQANSN